MLVVLEKKVNLCCTPAVINLYTISGESLACSSKFLYALTISGNNLLSINHIWH